MKKRNRDLPIDSFLRDFSILVQTYKFLIDDYHNDKYSEDDLYYLTCIDSCFCEVFETIRKLKCNLYDR